jgi:hypothetical protein
VLKHVKSHRRVLELEEERDKIKVEMDAIKDYDRDSGCNTSTTTDAADILELYQERDSPIS